MLCCSRMTAALTQHCASLLLGALPLSSRTSNADVGNLERSGIQHGSSFRPSAGCSHAKQQSTLLYLTSSQRTSFSQRLYGGAQFFQHYVHWVHMVQYYQLSASPRAPHRLFATRAIRRCFTWYLGALTLFPGHREAVGVGVQSTRLRRQCFAHSPRWMFSTTVWRCGRPAC